MLSLSVVVHLAADDENLVKFTCEYSELKKRRLIKILYSSERLTFLSKEFEQNHSWTVPTNPMYGEEDVKNRAITNYNLHHDRT